MQFVIAVAGTTTTTEPSSERPTGDKRTNGGVFRNALKSADTYDSTQQYTEAARRNARRVVTTAIGGKPSIVAFSARQTHN